MVPVSSILWVFRNKSNIVLPSITKDRARGAEMTAEKEEVEKEVHCMVRIHERGQRRGRSAKEGKDKKIRR